MPLDFWKQRPRLTCIPLPLAWYLEPYDRLDVSHNKLNGTIDVLTSLTTLQYVTADVHLRTILPSRCKS